MGERGGGGGVLDRGRVGERREKGVLHRGRCKCRLRGGG